MDGQVFTPPPPPPPPPPPGFFGEPVTPQFTSVPPPPPAPSAPSQPATTTTTTTTEIVTTPPSTQERVWLHPWTAAEMREHASQWSLAGDAGLLLSLEQFSDRLIQRADTIQQHLNQTVNAVKSTHTRVQNCLNEFTSLANTQFIENRVYDEDETVNAAAAKKDEQTPEKANVSATEAQEKVLARYVEAIRNGLAVLDTHFERVDPKAEHEQNGLSSFVDDDDEDAGIVIEPLLEPKDPYILRPLPYLIGTSEFMQDNYVGLGDLLTIHDEDVYNVEKIEKIESSDISSTSEDDDDDFQVEVSAAPLVPAGASRPDPISRAPAAKTNTVLTDSEDDDDPFAMNSTPAFNFSSASADTRGKSTLSVPVDRGDSGQASDNEESSLFGIPTVKVPPVPESQNRTRSNVDNEPASDADEPKNMGGVSMIAGAQRGMSELEKAVLRRLKAMGGPDAAAAGDDDDDEPVVRKPTKTSNDTGSSITAKATPSSSTISALASQPLTNPEKISRPSIFSAPVADEDDDDDIFSDAPKLKSATPVVAPPTTRIDPKPALIVTPQKVKDIFDNDSDEDDDPFAIKKKENPVSAPIKKVESKIQPTVVVKPKPIIQQDDSDEDELFASRKQPKIIPPVVATPVIEKPKAPSSDDDLFPTSTISKAPSTKQQASDPDPLLVSKPVVQLPPPAPVPIAKPVIPTYDDSDDEIFGIAKAKVVPSEPSKLTLPSKPADKDDPFGIATTRPQPAVIKPTPNNDVLDITKKPPVAPVKATRKVDSPKTSDEEDDLFGIPKAKAKPPTPAAVPKVITTVKKNDDDDDDDLFPSKSVSVQLPPPVVLPPLPSVPSVEATSKVEQAKKSIESKNAVSDSDEELFTKRPQNTAALKEGEKPNVKALSSRLNINMNAHKPGSTRPKAPSISEESPKSVPDETEPTQTVADPPKVERKLPPALFDSDEDDLFKPTKKETPAASSTERKNPTPADHETSQVNVKALSSLIKINPLMHAPGAQPKPSPREETEPTHAAPSASIDAPKEELTADKTMLNILKDRTKVSVKTRTPPTRKPRSNGTATASSTNDIDDLFALPSSSNEVASPPPPVKAPAVVPSPPVATGLPPPAAAAATSATKKAEPVLTKDKKKFSLFDSDDSDVDEVLFGANRKKTPSTTAKSPAVTTKATARSSILPLDDDDEDFLSRRPVRKIARPLDNDDIFADVTVRSSQTNKAKKDWSIMKTSATDDTDDIFNTASANSSTANSKSEPTTKPKANVVQIFDDPLNVLSKP